MNDDRDTIPRIEYLEPASWETHEWTPSRVRDAWIAAEEGFFQLAADLTQRVHTDDRIKSAFGKRIRRLLSCDLSFEAAEEKRRARGLVKALEADDDFDLIAPEDVLTGLLKWGLSLGVGLAEKVWTRSPEHGDRDIPVLKLWSPRWLRLDRNTRRWFVQPAFGPEVEILKDDPKWFLFFPYGEHEFWAEGLWWPLANLWLIKCLASNDWSSFNRAAGTAIPVGEAPVESKPETRDKWQDQLQRNLRRGRAVVLPPGYKLSYLLAERGAHESFKDREAGANRAVDILVLGGNLGTEVDGGSLAAAEVHERSEQNTAEGDGKVFGGQLRRGVLTWWALFNFGDRALAPWPYWDTEEVEDLKKKGDGFLALGKGIAELQTQLTPYDLEVDVPDLVAKLRIPTRKRAALLAALAPPAPPALPAGPEIAPARPAPPALPPAPTKDPP